LIGYWLWMVLLLLSPLSRIHSLALMGITAIGFSFRRGASMKWVLITLTLEGAVRVGLLLSLCVLAWRRL
ncbi:MAG: hypothetical protein V4773_22005, partial [Verrucomicrobiota bacterium]